MKAKNLLLTLAVGAMAISCNNSGSMTQTSASLKTTADSASFYIGYMYGSGLQQMGFSEVNREALIAGLNSAIAKKEVGKDPREIQMFLNGFMQEVAMKKATENAEKGKKFVGSVDKSLRMSKYGFRSVECYYCALFAPPYINSKTNMCEVYRRKVQI